MVINNLLEISQSISNESFNERNLTEFLESHGVFDKVYIELLLKKNGLICFESALQIYPYDNSNISLKVLNSNDTWKRKYSFINHLYFCFAQDFFGFQFCFTKKGVELLNTETGGFDFLAENFENWIELILDDYNYLTGFEVGHQWQKKFGQLNLYERLTGKIPFVLGGNYSIENLYTIDSIELLDFRADLANQIYYLEDGQQISLKNI